MRSLTFASNNDNKLSEIKKILNGLFEVVSLKDAGILIDIPEPHNSLEENASEKSKTIYRLTGNDCFSEDTGLEVSSLNNEPGVKSARYAGEPSNASLNIKKLLEKMEGVPDRRARFRTVISLIMGGNETQFEGICEGRITAKEKGDQGFGYDAIFIPDGSDLTFAEMTMDEKNKYSHRKKATAKLIEFLTFSHGKN